MKRGRRNCESAIVFGAFGAGLLCCTLFPSKLVIVLLGAALVACGCCCVNG